MGIPKIKVVRDGIVAVVDAYILCFFSNETHKVLIKHIEKVLGMYLDIVGFHSLPYYLDEEGEVVDIYEKTYHEFKSKFFDCDTEQDRSVIKLIGAIDDETGYRFTYIADDLPDENHPHLRNLVSFWIPIERCAELGWEKIFEFSCLIADELPLSYGYGSPCLCYSNNYIREAIGVTKRYPGMDIALGRACRVDIGNKALGVYWLSFFGEALCRYFESESKTLLAGQLQSSITVSKLADLKTVVRLGSEPEVGDSNRKVGLPLYRQFAKVLKDQLHIPRCVYFPDENGEADKDTRKDFMSISSP